MDGLNGWYSSNQNEMAWDPWFPGWMVGQEVTQLQLVKVYPFSHRGKQQTRVRQFHILLPIYFLLLLKNNPQKYSVLNSHESFGSIGSFGQICFIWFACSFALYVLHAWVLFR